VRALYNVHPVLMQLAVYDCIGRKIEVQETVNKIFNFCQAIFAPPSKLRPCHVPCLSYPRYATVGYICNTHG